MVRVLCRAILLWLALVPVARAEVLVYAVTDESWAPYWIVDGERISGILHDFMIALDARLPDDLQASHPLPPLRTQKLFREGQVQIECCVSQSWRRAAGQAEVSLWSIPVLDAEEMLLFAPGRGFPFRHLEDLRGRSIATVRGYGYVGSEYFQRNDGADAHALIFRVAQGHSEAGILDRLEWRYLRSRDPQLQAPSWQVEEGAVINRSQLRLRLHRDHAGHLAAINEAIRALQEDGTLARIVAEYAPQAHVAGQGEIR
ncbi:ABC transporter substrate-binding protein [Pseudomonas sp. REST10]|uniref:substrate-binding periplasmic protein n=1 Tax=Pseudomonas sp. REST10 TaxID=2512235 RepID=UPI00240D8F47|nr:ABC transporter substrate-binding protein [Pseudomonas sp. REST10]WFC63657.1 ABC transporter substrate-binding protein [Pseudomonas sp. REST10]